VDWTEELLRRMYRESPKGMKSILTALAERAGEEVSIAEVAQSFTHKPGADWNNVAGTLGAFEKRVKNRYGLLTSPFDWRRNEGQGMLYVMSPEVAPSVRSRHRPIDDGHGSG
jgi:hypothetical protein